MVSNYRDLKIWQEAMNLCTSIYNVTESFPKQELYLLTSQMRRSASSIASNIAEGFARKYTAEFKRFLSISLGSIAELETQLELSKRLNYIPENKFNEITIETEKIGKMITKLYKSLK